MSAQSKLETMKSTWALSMNSDSVKKTQLLIQECQKEARATHQLLSVIIPDGSRSMHSLHHQFNLVSHLVLK